MPLPRCIANAAIIMATSALVSCRGARHQPTSTSTAPSPSRVTPTRTLSPSIATITAKWATEEARGSPTPQPPTPTPSPATRLEPPGCIDLVQAGPQELPGQIVYSADGLEIYHGETGRLTTLYTEPQGWFLEVSDFPRTSPDLSRLAVEVEGPAMGAARGDSVLFLLDRTGVLPTITEWEPNWGDVVGWLGDDRVLLSSEEPGKHTMYALDPSTGIAEPVPMAFPDQRLFTAGWYPMYSVEIASLSGDGALAVYLGAGPGASDSHLVLWDVPTGIEVWRSPPSWGSQPLWNPDSSQFAYSAEQLNTDYSPSPDLIDYEVFVVNRLGDVTKLTDFTKWRSQQEVDIPDVVWSPDGTHVAYFLGTRDSPDEEFTYNLAATSLDSLTTTVFCTEFDRTQRPQWSPDSRFLAVTGGRVIDTQGASVLQVIDGGMPLGWIVDAP